MSRGITVPLDDIAHSYKFKKKPPKSKKFRENINIGGNLAKVQTEYIYSEKK